MGPKLILLTILCLTIISCRQTEKSKEVMKEAMDVYLFSEIADSIKIAKSLELTNRALELDDHSIPALTHKTTLLFRRKDIDGLLQIADHLIKLRPEKPLYLGQKALYLELKGDTIQAKEYYDKSVYKYQEHIKTDSLDFNLMMEYIGVLETSGDTTLANKTLERMEMYFDESQKHMIELYKRQSFQKEQLKKYLKGEIEYEQINRD